MNPEGITLKRQLLAQRRKEVKKGRIVSLEIRYQESLWVMFFLCALA